MIYIRNKLSTVQTRQRYSVEPTFDEKDGEEIMEGKKEIIPV